MCEHVARFKPETKCSTQIAKLFNHLLGETKTEVGEDKTIALVEPIEPSAMSGLTNTDYGTVHASLGQMRKALSLKEQTQSRGGPPVRTSSAPPRSWDDDPTQA